MADEVNATVQGDGFAVANVDALAEGPGFRKVRKVLRAGKDSKAIRARLVKSVQPV